MLREAHNNVWYKDTSAQYPQKSIHPPNTSSGSGTAKLDQNYNFGLTRNIKYAKCYFFFKKKDNPKFEVRPKRV